jgi:hypothetical protein
MDTGQMKLMLSPKEGGSYTRLSLCGWLPTALPGRELRRLLSMLSFWSGWPVRVVLSVDAQTASWCEVWTDALCAVPERHLEVQFQMAGQERADD